MRTLRNTAFAGAVALSMATGIAVIQPTTPASSQQTVSPEGLAAAQRFMKAAGVSQQFEAVMPMMAQNLANMLISQNPAKAGEINTVMKRLNDRILARKQELFDEIAKEHARRFSAKELDELSAFFSSGVGAKYIAVQPQMTQESMRIGQAWGNRIGQDVDAEMRRMAK